MTSRKQEKHEIANNIIQDIGKENLLNYFQQRLSEPKTLSTRSKIIEAYAHLAGVKAVPILMKICQNDNERSDVRITAVNALGTLKAKEAIQILINILDVPESNLKIATIKALSKIGEPIIIKPIMKLLDENQPSVINTAVEALLLLRAKESVSKLRDILESGKLDLMIIEKVRDFIQYEENVSPPQLIPDVINFIGREDEIQELCYVLEDESIVNIIGVAGIGKTSLAAKVVQLIDADHKLWIRCSNLNNVYDLYYELASQLAFLGETQPFHSTLNSKNMQNLLISTLNRQRYLLIFDDLELLIKDYEIKNFLKHLAKQKNLKLIVISRMNLELPEIYQYHLGELSITEAKEFIKSKNLSLNEYEIARIFKLTQGHPLGLQLALSIIEAYGLDELEDSFEKKFSLSNIVEQILERLDVRKLHALYILSIFDDSISINDKSVINVFESEGIDKPSEVLADLIKSSLVEEIDNKFRIVHPVLAENITSKIDLTDLRRLQRKIGEYYLNCKNNPLHAAHLYKNSGDNEYAVEILISHKSLLIGKIEKESDIEKIRNCLSFISDISLEVGKMVVKSLDLNDFKLKIGKESQIEIISNCLKAIFEIDEGTGIALLKKIKDDIVWKIRATTDFRAIMNLLDTVREIDENIARELELESN